MQGFRELSMAVLLVLVVCLWCKCVYFIQANTFFLVQAMVSW